MPLLIAAALAVAATACGGGVYHKVRPGDTLYRIGKAYGVSHERLAKVNRISDPTRIYVGQKIFIPEGNRELPVDVITPSNTRVERDEPRASARVAGSPFLDWPVPGGELSSRFGDRGSSFHDGIDIRAPIGTPVKAACEGVVIYSDVLRGYGNVIIVRHTNGFATVYAHNNTNLVRADDRVARGQVIAHVGVSGRTSGPNLHFEVRKNNVAHDPLHFLATRGQASSRPAADTGG